MNPQVSIIVPCYNQELFLAETLESVKRQSYSNWECIIMDDGSTDNSKEVAHAFCEKDNRFHYYYQNNQGLSATRNNGIKKSCGIYILPLDADDLIHKDYIAEAVDVLEKREDVKVVYCRAELFGEKTGEWELTDYSIEAMLNENCIFCTAMYRRADFDLTSGYNTNMKYGWEDWDFWLSFIELGLKPYKIPETLFYYRKHYHKSMLKKVPDFQKTLWKQIVNNHPKLYLNSDESIERIFISADTHSKYVKYKKVFKILFPIIIIENIFIILYFIYKVLMG